MSMYTALSGINAAQADIGVTAHNIANVSTFGYKSSRVEFADIFSNSPLSVARTSIGSGVQVAGSAQSFTQGNISTTGNVLDLAIEGPGFFAIKTTTGNQAETQYTRAGAFRRDVDGTIVNAAGSALLGWPVAQDGTALSNDPKGGFPMSVPPTMGEASATANVKLQVQLPEDDAMLGGQVAVPPAAAFDVDDPTTFAKKTPITVFDQYGQSYDAEMYFTKLDSPDAGDPTTTWDTHLVINGSEVVSNGGSTTAVFNANGVLQSGGDATYDVFGESLAVNLGGSELHPEDFVVESAAHDGKTPSGLYAVEIDPAGTVYATYSSGDSVAMGKIFLANFPNSQGLRQMGATALSATALSGDPILGSPGETGFGYMRSGALERSNVDLTAELVNLITAQRNYQASAKAMETSSSLSQTIINMRS